MPSTTPTPGPGFSGKLADPRVRHERAVKAARARHSLDTYIDSIVDRAPALTDAQRQRLALLLHPGATGGAQVDSAA